MRNVRQPDFLATVRDNWRKTTGFIVAGRQPCIKIRDDEVANVRRSLVALSMDAVSTLEPPASWAMAVILCPGDDTRVLATWAAARRVNRARIWFYMYPSAGFDVFTAWREAGFRGDQVNQAGSWQELHSRFGQVLNSQVYADWRGGLPPSKPAPARKR